MFAPCANGLVRPRALSILSRAQQLPASRCRTTGPLPTTLLSSRARLYSSEPAPEKTPLYDLHAKYGAKFVPFGGFQMPVQYSDLSLAESHNWTREKASLFDVSHMYARQSRVRVHC